MKILEILTPKRLLGSFGERSAAKYLRKNGYKILEMNYVTDGHEIDIIARGDGVTAFIEVKTRTVGREDPREVRPAASVDRKKQQSIIEAARGYLAMNRTETKKRFDIIEVLVSDNEKKKRVERINHLINTFNLNTAYPPKKIR